MVSHQMKTWLCCSHRGKDEIFVASCDLIAHQTQSSTKKTRISRTRCRNDNVSKACQLTGTPRSRRTRSGV